MPVSYGLFVVGCDCNEGREKTACLVSLGSDSSPVRWWACYMTLKVVRVCRVSEEK